MQLAKPQYIFLKVEREKKKKIVIQRFDFLQQLPLNTPLSSQF